MNIIWFLNVLPSKSITIGTLLEYFVDNSRTASLDGWRAVVVVTVVVVAVDVVIAVVVVDCVVEATGVVVWWLHSKESHGHPDLQLALNNIISDFNYGIILYEPHRGNHQFLLWIA